MTVLLDTNVWAYAFDEKSPLRGAALEVLERGNAGLFEIGICPQVLMELYSVLSRKHGGLETPLAPFTAARIVRDLALSQALHHIAPTPKTPLTTAILAARMEISGPRVHDLFLAATALDNGVGRLCTADERFPQVPDLEVWNPFK